ncbi:hypothetical protein N7519_008842 [Penicillium mononematosum]|uniref:uncharacterized protein n=1 Tax=Penicillium mononematosum TaxID=268346 RepID=UPI002547FD5D|nr:uncharacterized protein N7519_008842 [Penicillium mononematosum]KAJ6178381.1 hypothetical protein N7519_008842 [Penicillium mononematosum]
MQVSSRPPSSRRPSHSEMRGRAPLPVASGAPQNPQNGHSRNPSALDVARSPPNQNNKKCELIFLQSSMQIPNMFLANSSARVPVRQAPLVLFLHSTDAGIDYAPCKYFAKGNCKFGAKCALAHILPDGRRVNRPTGNMGMGSGHLNLGGRVNPQAYVNQDSALTNSVLSQQRMNGHEQPRYAPQLAPQEEYGSLHGQQQPSYDGIPTIDTGLASDAGSKYGSPAEDVRYPMSPSNNHLSALDAGLPASFDSQGISHAARYGPVAASMPSQFGLESPPPQRPGQADVFRNLRDIGYGTSLRKPSSNIGSSPPAPEDTVGTRFMHSSRPVKPRMLSASVPRPTALEDWDENFPMEEDYLPVNLHDDVLTPQEKLRRLSRTDNDLSSSHRDISGLGMTSTSFSKTGSPLASSPSRFGALFAKQRQRKEEESHGSSSFHIVLAWDPLAVAGHPTKGRRLSLSPGRQSSMSMISEQLGGMGLHPGSARQSSAGPSGPTGRLDRIISSPVNTSKIEEEEQSDLVFDMEEEVGNKRNSASWSENKESSS